MMDFQPASLCSLLLSTTFLFGAFAACSSSETGDSRPEPSTDAAANETDPEIHKSYTVTRLSEPVTIDSEWNKAPWNGIEPLHIANHMGDEPEHRPGVQAKVAYDDEAIYVIYRVEDQYVQCGYTEYQDPVFRDSTVEFFFTPSDNLENGYFNLEMNCIGTALFHFQRGQGENRERARLSQDHFDQITIAHSLDPEEVATEMEDPVTWTMEYRIPFEILESYSSVDQPASGVQWRANFYKCADDTSHPHWLTWSKIERDRPNFHVPEYFGTLVFE